MSDKPNPVFERWRRLTPPLTPFPARCGYCALPMRDDEQLSVVEGRLGPRAVHSKCRKKTLREEARNR